MSSFLKKLPRAESPAPFTAAWAAAYVSIVLLLFWARAVQPAFLMAGVAAWAAAIAYDRRRASGDSREASRPWWRARPFIAVLGLIALAAGIAGLTERRLDRLGAEWPRLRAAQQQQLTTDLKRRMSVVIERGDRAAERAAARAEADEGNLFAELADVQDRSQVAALAVFDRSGRLIAWAGDHRGAFPAAVRRGSTSVAYTERPLFSYLYFSSPVEGTDLRAVAVALLESGQPLRDAVAAFGSRFEERTGAHPDFSAGGAEDAAWSLVRDGEAIVHATIEPVTQAEWRRGVTDAGRRGVVVFGLAALLVLAWSWRRKRRTGATVPILSFIPAFAVAPVGAAFGLEWLFSPALFLLPGGMDLSLGRLLLILLPVAALVATQRPLLRSRFGRYGELIGGMLVVGIGFTAGIHGLASGAAPPLLESGVRFWGALLPAAVLLLTTLALLVLPRAPERGRRIRPVQLAAGLTVSLLLALAILGRWRLTQAVEGWLPLLWMAPFGLVALGVAGYRGRGSRLIRWLGVGWIATTAIVPQLWVTQMDARVQAAERELATLGVRADPFVDYLLRRFGADVVARNEEGEGDVELLYRAWVSSGLARSAHPVRLSLWVPGRGRTVGLALNGAKNPRYRSGPALWVLGRIIRRARAAGEPVIQSAADAPGANQILAVPLPDGRVVSVVVLPRRQLDRATLLAPFVGGRQSPHTRLTLVPTQEAGTSSGVIRWKPIERGWRSEMGVRYPEGHYHAHFELRVPSTGVLFARGVLLLALSLAVLAALWAIGRIGRGDPPRPPGGWARGWRSFRARVTVALFAFFVLPTALFGAVAYRALSGEVTRTARTVAERAVTQAVEGFSGAGGNLTALSQQVGQELLYYHGGELAQASSPEAIDLGIFGAWMPPDVFRTLGGGDESGAVEVRELGGQSYLVAYRPLPAAGTLAVPVPLAASDAAVRQQELAHLILFAVLMGGILSLALSMAAGRALARPIGRLRRAAAEVGHGRLHARLPERRTDEFGDLFRSFNRMTERLLQARGREVRTARVLAWGEMARQVAHEIKNPLTPIKLSVQHLRRASRDGRPDFDEILDRNVDQILGEIDHLGEIARVFSRYGAPPEAAGPLEAVDVASVVREALTLYRTGESGVEYRAEIENALPPARTRRGELREVLLNLLENAREAVGREGRVVLSVGRAGDGDAVEVRVRDDGAGIPEPLLESIFEPHFSTRSSGTGLGLAIVRRLVEGWGGEVSADSEAGRGTTIRVRMPVGDGGSPAEEN